MLVASGLIQTRRHLKELAFVVVAALSLLVIDLLWRYFFFIRPTIEPDRLEAAFSHENGILIALLIAIGGAGLLWEKTWGRRFLWLAVATLAVVLLLVLRRRTGLVAGEAALLALGVALLLRRPARFALVGPLVLALTVGYLTIYWNHPNGLGQPARAFRTVIGSEVKTERDRASDEYRKAESLNVWWNIQAKPIIGTGLGKPYPKPLYFVNLSYFWPFWDFIPHNTVLHLWMKAGVFAFMAFIYLVGTGISQSLSIVRASRDRWVVASASVIAAYIVMTVLFSYVDLGLTNTRVMVPFGVALGIIGPLQRLVDRESAPEAAPVAGAL
jgi:O-antigen ligase